MTLYEILKKIIEGGGIGGFDGRTEYGDCFYCSAVQFRPHDESCIWKTAKEYIERQESQR